MKENTRLEFKASVTNTFLKTVSAYANYMGGEILFGIDDSGSVVGLNNCEQVCLDIENKINDSISPQPEYELEIIEGNIIRLHVSSGQKKPYMYKSKAYKRNDTATIEVDSIELTRLILEGRNISYEELPSENQELSFSILEKRLMDVVGVDACDKNVLKTLNLYSDKDGYNIAAEILADQNDFPGIDIGKFGESISIIQKRKIFDQRSILSVYDAACEVYKDYYQYEVIEGVTRKTVEKIPEEAFREAIANALIHRIWDTKSQIRVFMFDDQIEVYSPGGLPQGLSKEEYLAGNVSNLRNSIISNVFFRLGLVEVFGTGIRRIKEVYAGSITQPMFDVLENSIKVVLPIVKTETALNEEFAVVYKALDKHLGKPISEIMKTMPFGKTKVRSILNELISQKLVYTTGNGRGTKYYKR